MGWDKAPKLTDSALEALVRHNWPGNVRELANAIARAVVLAGRRDYYDEKDLMLRSGEAGFMGDVTPTLAEAEKRLIQRILATHPSRRAAAEAMGISSSTLYDKIHKYGLDDSE